MMRPVLEIIRELAAQRETVCASRSAFPLINRTLNDNGHKATVSRINGGLVEFTIERDVEHDGGR